MLFALHVLGLSLEEFWAFNPSAMGRLVESWNKQFERA